MTHTIRNIRSSAPILACLAFGLAACSTQSEPDAQSVQEVAEAAEATAVETSETGTLAAVAATDTPEAAPVPQRLATVAEADSVVSVIADHPDLTQFAALVEAYDQPQVFTQARGVTLLIPNDAAFDAMDDATYDALLTDGNEFTLFLSDHMAIGTKLASELSAAGQFTNALARSLPVTDVEDQLTIGGATVVEADLEADNGVVHIIDHAVAAG